MFIVQWRSKVSQLKCLRLAWVRGIQNLKKMCLKTLFTHLETEVLCLPTDLKRLDLHMCMQRYGMLVLFVCCPWPMKNTALGASKAFWEPAFAILAWVLSTYFINMPQTCSRGQCIWAESITQFPCHWNPTYSMSRSVVVPVWERHVNFLLMNILVHLPPSYWLTSFIHSPQFIFWTLKSMKVGSIISETGLCMGHHCGSWAGRHRKALI